MKVHGLEAETGMQYVEAGTRQVVVVWKRPAWRDVGQVIYHLFLPGLDSSISHEEAEGRKR